MTFGEEEDICHADGGTGLLDSDGTDDPLPGLSDGLGESSPSQRSRAEGGIERRDNAWRDKEGAQ